MVARLIKTALFFATAHTLNIDFVLAEDLVKVDSHGTAPSDICSRSCASDDIFKEAKPGEANLRIGYVSKECAICLVTPQSEADTKTAKSLLRQINRNTQNQ